MDAFYDKDAAAAELEEVASIRREALGARLNSSIVHMADINVEALTVKEMGVSYKNWRLCMPDEEEGISEEMVVRIQGILTHNGLVPRNAHACTHRKAIFLSQQVEICGLGTDTFDEAVRMVPVVVDRFEQHLGGAELGSIQEVESDGGKVFRASNRIFTLKANAPTEQDNAFQNGLDPLNVLHRLKNSELIHAPDNIVRYYKRVEANGNIAYDQTVPGAFKSGDLVELQVSFVAIKAAMNKVKVTTRLQAVTMLSNKLSKEAAQNRSMSRTTITAQVAVRRRVGYFEEDDEAERKVKKRRVEAAEDRMTDN